MFKMTGVGRLTKDAELFTYGGGDEKKTGIRFSLASNDWRNPDTADFLNCVMFRGNQSLADNLKQGDQVMVSGNYQNRPREDGDQYNTSCVVEDLEFGAKKQKRD